MSRSGGRRALRRHLAFPLVACLAGAGAHAETGPLSPAEQQGWLDWLIPLPHEIRVQRAVTVKPADVGLQPGPAPGAVTQQALSDLRGLFKERAGVDPSGAAFKIALKLADGTQQQAAAARLRGFPNSEQAYLIESDGDKALTVAALTEKGLYYGAQTVRQLLERTLAPAAVTVPLVSVADWPDFEERGMWNTPVSLCPWYASLKLNFADVHSSLKFHADKPVAASFDRRIWELERAHAMRDVVRVTHLNYWYKLYGLSKLYPDVVGKGKEAIVVGEAYKRVGRDIPVICASNPRWPKLVAEALESLAAQGVREVSVWLSEFTGHCQCKPCLAAAQVANETRCVLAGWRRARARHPDLTLRIFYSQGDASTATSECLRSVPAEVKIERVYSVYKPFLEAAARGQWVCTYTGVGLTGIHLLFCGDPLHAGLKRAFDNRLKGHFIMGSHPGLTRVPAYFRALYDYRVHAQAEWAWNVKGRDPAAFRLAWATRHGYEPAGKAAEWLAAAERLSAALSAGRGYAGFSASSVFLGLSAKIRGRREVSFYTDEVLAQLTELVASMLPLAEGLGKPDLAHETRYYAAFLAAHRALNTLSTSLRKLDASRPETRTEVEARASALASALRALGGRQQERFDLLTCEPAAFAETLKERGRRSWDAVLKEISAAVAEVLSRADVAERLRPELSIPWTDAPPRVDGALDENLWRHSARIEGLLDKDAQPATPSAEVRICRDDKSLYVAFACIEPTPDRIRRTAVQEADAFRDDCVAVLLKPGKGAEHFQFAVSAGGVKFDQRSGLDGRDAEGYSPEWSAAVRIAEQQWTAEMAIPLAALGVGHLRPGAIWGGMFGRCRRAGGPGALELSSWTGSVTWHNVAEYGWLRF